jgi:TRAP-type uncharacterized transport system fused permease subunit
MFVYEPALLTIGDPVTVIWRFAASCVGVTCFAAALQGWFLYAARWWERAALLAAALLLIKPDVVTDVIGLALLTVILVTQKMARPAIASPVVAPEEARRG